MISRTLLALGACFFAASCATTPRHGNPQQAAGPGATAGPTSAEWYSASRVPPRGFLLTNQDPLVGRNVEDQESNVVGTIFYTLYQPAAGDTTRYVAISDRRYYGYLLVPVSGLRITQEMAWVDQTRAELLSQRHYSLAELEEHYPPTNMRQAAIVPTPGAALPPVAVTPSSTAGYSSLVATQPIAVSPPPTPLVLAWRGGAVGAPVQDSRGTPVGTLAAQAVEPRTGSAYYAIIAGPSIGSGYYIAAPVADVQYVNGRVVLDAPLESWQQLPHYQATQLQQIYGAAGVIR